jgi:putative glutamine amidotransferase
MKPLIGVPTDPFSSTYENIALSAMEKDKLEYFWLLERLTEKICYSVRRAGGVPVMLSAADDAPEIGELTARCDGFVFAGGNDIDPSFYGESNKGSIAPNIERDRFELTLLKSALGAGKPVLGICRGCQLINVALGGDLHQNLPDLKPEWKLHKRSDVTEGYVHDVDVLMPEYFPSLKGRVMRVNSMHHQVVNHLASDLEITAQTRDGLVEGVAMLSSYVVGVQWHPECLSGSDPLQAEIFSRLVTVAKN